MVHDCLERSQHLNARFQRVPDQLLTLVIDQAPKFLAMTHRAACADRAPMHLERVWQEQLQYVTVNALSRRTCLVLTFAKSLARGHSSIHVPAAKRFASRRMAGARILQAVQPFYAA